MLICDTLIIHQFTKNYFVLRTLVLGVKYIPQEELEIYSKYFSV
jgi:hypothetical protein